MGIGGKVAGSVLGVGASVAGIASGVALVQAQRDAAKFAKEQAKLQAENTKKQAEFQAKAQLEQARYEAHVLDRERLSLGERAQLSDYSFGQAVGRQQGLIDQREEELFGLGEEFSQFRGQTLSRQAGSGLSIKSRSFQNIRKLNETRYQENRRRVEAAGAQRIQAVDTEKAQYKIDYFNALRGAEYARYDRQFTLAQAKKASDFTKESGLAAQTLTLQGGRAQASQLRRQALGQGLGLIGQSLNLIGQLRAPPTITRG